MSTIVVSNIHFESTANNRIQLQGSNVSVYQTDILKVTANSTDVSFFNGSNTYILGLNNEPDALVTGDYIFSSNTSAPSNFVEAGSIQSISNTALANLYSSLGSPTQNYQIWKNVTTANNLSINHVTYGNGVFVAVGESGSIQSSTDGTTWTNRTTANTNGMNGVAYGNGVFVAVGSVGSIQTSTNGITWTNRTTANTNNIFGVGYGNGIFVSVGSVGSIQTSTNGITWTNRTTANTLTDNYDAAYGNGVYVVVGGAGGAGTLATIMTSTNGITWTNRTSANPNERVELFGITYADGKFVAVSENGIQTSTDGTTWSNAVVNFTSNFSDIAYGNNLFVTFSTAGIVYFSQNGTHWYTNTNFIEPDVLGPGIITDFRNNSLEYGNGIFVSVGQLNSVASNPGAIKISNTNSFHVPQLEFLRFIDSPIKAYVKV